LRRGGIIYDRFDNPLIYNTPRFDLIADLADFFSNSEEVQDEILSKIADIVPVPDLKQKIDEAYGEARQTTLIKGIKHTNALVFETIVNDWPGIRIQQNAQRQYILGPYFSHIIGYTGEVSQSDLEKYPNYFLSDEIGKVGLEKQYEDYLRGEPGQEQIEVDSLGKTTKNSC